MDRVRFLGGQPKRHRHPKRLDDLEIDFLAELVLPVLPVVLGQLRVAHLVGMLALGRGSFRLRYAEQRHSGEWPPSNVAHRYGCRYRLRCNGRPCGFLLTASTLPSVLAP